MSAVFAFLHHLAVFTLVGALAVEFVLLRGELDLPNARRLSIVDAIYGASAAALLIVGLLRVFYFEMGAEYYFHSAPFLAKLSLFVLVGAMSIVPTAEILSWRKLVAAQQLPQVSAVKMRRLRTIVHWELAAIVFIVLFAALMARGVGFIG